MSKPVNHENCREEYRKKEDKSEKHSFHGYKDTASLGSKMGEYG
jgi:hypothetical protein